MRNDAELAKKNIEIGFEFSRLLLAHPELEEKLPEGAVVLFEVGDDPELTAFNRAMAVSTKAAGQPVITVRIKGLAPTRLLEPEVV